MQTRLGPIDLTLPDSEQALAKALTTDLTAGLRRCERYFGKPFAHRFPVTVFSQRALFDRFLQEKMSIPTPQRWMVATGTGTQLGLLSPRVWATEASEHDPKDTVAIREIIAHELVHVYHGQHCPRPDFDQMDELGWWIEGLAAHVSGQLERAHRDDARQALAQNALPKTLADAWSGRWRYGVCGSLVAFIEQRHGKKAILALLAVTDNAQALAQLRRTESELLTDWVRWLKTTSNG